MSAPPPRELRGRRVTVQGLGLFGGGAAVARHLVARGARVTVTDLRDAEVLAPTLAALAGLELRLVLGEHREEDFRAAELVVANPAVPRSSPFLEAARAAGVPITSEVALLLDATPARVVGVTGTQGKSSTATFLAQLCDAAGLRTRLGGNIGRSLLAELDAMDADDVCVLELSSYQLETLPDELARRGEEAPLEIAVVTNVLSDHLERHGTREAYAAAKRRILELVRPGGAAVLHASALEGLDPAGRAAALGGLRVFALAEGPPRGRGLEERDGRCTLDGRPLAGSARAPFPPGFQQRNVLAALGAARRLGIGEQALELALPRLAPPPHRLEALAPVRGHAVWDNAVSTTPDSTVAALGALPAGCTLLAGGRPKAGLDAAPLVARAAERARRVVLFGELGGAWAAALRAAGVETHAEPDLATGIERAFATMEPGETLLFSPAAASFDAWPNWEARARAFRAALEALVTPRAAAAGSGAPPD